MTGGLAYPRVSKFDILKRSTSRESISFDGAALSSPSPLKNGRTVSFERVAPVDWGLMLLY
jgi:hypothetical protein